MSGWVFFWIIAVVIIYCVIVYNRLVALKQERANSFSDIDVQLKLRYDLIPNLVESVKAQAAHESGVLEKVTNARARALNANNMDEKIDAEKNLNSALAELKVVAENYSDLKANQNFQNLQNELSEIEGKIAASRQYFNSTTEEYNAAVQEFPAVFIASKMGFKSEQLFEPTAKANIVV